MFGRQSIKRLYGCKVSHKLHHRSYNTSHYIIPVLGLRPFCPCDAIENYLHSMHDHIGFPYIFGIITIPFLTKYIIRLPLDVLSTKIYEASLPSLPAANEDKFESFLTILQRKTRTEPHVLLNYIRISMKQFQTKVIQLFPSLAAFYIHLSSYLAIERMSFHENANDTLFMLTHNYLASTDTQYFLFPIINGFGFMFCYAFITRYKSANFSRRRKNVMFSFLFIPTSALFFSSAFHFYIMSNMIAIGLYQLSTIHNESFQKTAGFLTNDEKYHHSNMEKLSNLYIEWNHVNFKTGSISVFTKSFQSEKMTHLTEDIEAVLQDDELFIPSIPPKDYFRNIQDEIDYFDDEYDEFMERIEHKHQERYLEANRDKLLLDQRDTLSLDDDEVQTPAIGMQKEAKMTE